MDELESEKEALEAIFLSDFETCEEAPGNFKITVVPHPADPENNHSCVKLFFSCSDKYPSNDPPEIKVEKVRGLSDAELAELEKMLNSKAASLVGSAMVWDLTEACKEFLLERNRKPVESLWSDYMARQTAIQMETEERQRQEEARHEEQRQKNLDELQERIAQEMKIRAEMKAIYQSRHQPQQQQQLSSSTRPFDDDDAELQEDLDVKKMYQSIQELQPRTHTPTMAPVLHSPPISPDTAPFQRRKSFIGGASTMTPLDLNGPASLSSKLSPPPHGSIVIPSQKSPPQRQSSFRFPEPPIKKPTSLAGGSGRIDGSSFMTSSESESGSDEETESDGSEEESSSESDVGFDDFKKSSTPKKPSTAQPQPRKPIAAYSNAQKKAQPESSSDSEQEDSSEHSNSESEEAKTGTSEDDWSNGEEMSGSSPENPFLQIKFTTKVGSSNLADANAFSLLASSSVEDSTRNVFWHEDENEAEVEVKGKQKTKKKGKFSKGGNDKKQQRKKGKKDEWSESEHSESTEETSSEEEQSEVSEDEDILGMFENPLTNIGGGKASAHSNAKSKGRGFESQKQKDSKKKKEDKEALEDLMSLNTLHNFAPSIKPPQIAKKKGGKSDSNLRPSLSESDDQPLGQEKLDRAKELMTIHLLRLAASQLPQGVDGTDFAVQMGQKLSKLGLIDQSVVRLIGKEKDGKFAEKFEKLFGLQMKHASDKGASHSLFWDPLAPHTLQLANRDRRETSDSSTTQHGSTSIVVGGDLSPNVDSQHSLHGHGNSQQQEQQRYSRYRSDFIEKEILGEGGFGSVAKALNKLDGRYYAVKKIVLDLSDELLFGKIKREVFALSRLHHMHVVRYYNAWIEAADESETMGIDDEDEDEFGGSFFGEDSQQEEGEGGHHHAHAHSGSESEASTSSKKSGKAHDYRILYIQMEYCPRANLRQMIDKKMWSGSPDERWRILREILEGLAHIHSRGIIHRDLKPANIFFAAEGVKIGDLGLATQGVEEQDIPTTSTQQQQQQASTSLTSTLIQPSQSTDPTINNFGLLPPAEPMLPPTNPVVKELTKRNFYGSPMTSNQGSFGNLPDMGESTGMSSNIGTPIYCAPEQRGLRKYNEKVDIYSLGIIFFETLVPFGTESERYKTLMDLRMNGELPEGFESKFPKEAKIVRWCMQEDPAKRPSAMELLQSDLLPPKLEDEYMKDVLRTIAKPHPQFFSRLMDALFSQKSEHQEYLFDMGSDTKKKQRLFVEYSQNDVMVRDKVVQGLTSVFARHGAVPLDVPLLLPRSKVYDNEHAATYMDNTGAMVCLPYDLAIPFARWIARTNTNFLKRYSVAKVYSRNPEGGRPLERTFGQFDIVGTTYRMVTDAEMLKVACEVMAEFPPLEGDKYIVRVNHTELLRSMLNTCEVFDEKMDSTCRAISQLNRMGWSQIKRDMKLPQKCSADLERYVFVQGDLSDVVQDVIDTPLGRTEGAKKAFSELGQLFGHLHTLGLPTNLFTVDLSFAQPSKAYSTLSFYRGVIFEICINSKSGSGSGGSGGHHHGDTSKGHGGGGGGGHGGARETMRTVALGGRYDPMVTVFQDMLAIARFARPGTPPPIPSLGRSSFSSVSGGGAAEKHVIGVTVLVDNLINYCRDRETSAAPSGVMTCTEVVVCSLGGDLLSERMQICSELWSSGIKADFMYDDRLTWEEMQKYSIEAGVPVMVMLKDRTYKVKNLVRRTESEVSRAEVLKHVQIALASLRSRKTIGAGSSGSSLGLSGSLMMGDRSDSNPPSDSKQPMMMPSGSSDEPGSAGSMGGHHLSVPDVTVISTSQKGMKPKQKKMIIESAQRKVGVLMKTVSGLREIVAVKLPMNMIREAAFGFDQSHDAVLQRLRSSGSGGTEAQHEVRALLQHLKQRAESKVVGLYVYSYEDDKVLPVFLST